MAKLQYRTLSNRKVGKLEVEKETVFWDRELTGFGVRVYPTGTKVYVAQARGPEGPRRVAVGRYGVVHAEQARQRAAKIITRIKAGDEAALKPQKPAGGPTVADLARRYLEEYAAVRCKPKTQETARAAVPQAHPARLGQTAAHGGRARAGRGDAPAAVRDTFCREHSAPHPLSDVPSGRGMGTRPGRNEPLPLDRQIPRAQAGEVPDGQGIHALGANARRGRDARRRYGACGGRHPALDADRVPEERDTEIKMGGRGARRERTESPRRQDGRAGGPALAHRR